MESKSSRNRSEDQLQGSLEQDQAIQLGAAEASMKAQVEQVPGLGLQKVVIQFGDSVVKGYLEPQHWDSIEGVLSSAPNSPPLSFQVRLVGSDTVQEIATADAKAVFYVNDFEGCLLYTSSETKTGLCSMLHNRIRE